MWTWKLLNLLRNTLLKIRGVARRSTIQSVIKVGLISALLLLLGCGSDSETADSVSTEPSESTINKLVVQRYIEVRGTENYAEVSADTFSPGYRHIRSEFENFLYNMRDSELAQLADPDEIAIPDRLERADLIMGEGSTVVVRYYISGTHEGNFYGIPATGRAFEIPAVAIFELADGQIVSAWYMADEVGFLRQVGAEMPMRADGRYVIPPTGGEHAVASDDIMHFMLANPADSREYRNKLKVAARKANNPPPGIINEENGARPYDNFLRPGFKHVVEMGTINGDASQGFGGGYPDRVDLTDYFLIDGDTIMIRFRLTGTNTNNFYGFPATNNYVDAWEVAFMTFVDEHWRDAWWMGDDQSMLMQLGWPQSFWFPDMNSNN